MKFLRFIAVFALVFQLVSPVSAMTGNNGQPAHYLALGDSLAAGMLHDSSIGMGYADFLAEALEESDLLASYNKGFAYPGYTTANILAELATDVEKPSSTTGKKVKLLDEVKKADVITLSIGANDILAHLNRGEAGISFDAAQMSLAIAEIAQQVDEILETIAQLNPKADVFIMGYYNPFPYLTEYTEPFTQLVTGLDGAVQAVVEANEMYFVEVASLMASDVTTYLPNPLNIHPGEVGYEAIAQVFEEPVKSYITLTPLPQIIPGFSDVPKIHWSYDYTIKVAEYGIMNGYADGTFKYNNKLTRVHLTSMLTRALELEAEAKAPFTDIANYNAITQFEIAAAYEAGIVNGVGQLFKPSQPITRAEAALMIYNAYTAVTGEQYNATKLAPFADISTYNTEHQQAISMLYELGIATGDQGHFKPTNTLTRAQAAKMMVHFYEAVVMN